ncbi:MAG: hypothetical protein GF334_02100 [Candidatus Altiarchaeales archaeon]|nr:hypothetical protein [Candidatus Altiarchaeales archaeon]
MKYTREDALDFDKAFPAIITQSSTKEGGEWATVSTNLDALIVGGMAYLMAYEKYDDAMHARLIGTMCQYKASKILLEVPFEELPLYIKDNLCKDCNALHKQEEGICTKIAAWRMERGK